MEATFKTAEGIDQVIDFIRAWDYGNEPLKVKVYGAGHTRPYESVFWIWMRAITRQYVERKMPDYEELDKEGQNMHLILCKRHLGMIPPLKVSKTETPERIRTLTHPKKLDKSEWFHLMRSIEQDCMAMGITLPDVPNEYSEAKRKQDR
jgi:hypothetical protein